MTNLRNALIAICLFAPVIPCEIIHYVWTGHFYALPDFDGDDDVG